MRTRSDRRGPTPIAGPGRAVVVKQARDPLVVGALTLAATAYVALVDPNSPGHYLTCPMLSLTGLYCPACGGLRAVHDLAHLDLVGAWGMNPLVVLAVPLLAGAWARWLRRSWSTRSRPPTEASNRRSTRLAWIVLVVVVCFGVLRNVPALAPWLAP
ncbi:DUF2752 domain-containing protein [Pengzhenrongella sp.]|uniref:DUF2752 domain-containing protein n=1 Tax=Pengzhenrongella sp. TaxID=2888820 RepID=UPI002F945DDD